VIDVGNVVEIIKSELQMYIDNTKKALASTVDRNNVLVGFPVDGSGHNHEDAAGWIKDVSMSESGEVVQFSVEWTNEGQEAISSNSRRYFSPEIDLMEKVIMGGSLTNWPATRSKKHEMLLKPVTLSLFSADEPDDETLVEKIKQVLSGLFPGKANLMEVQMDLENATEEQKTALLSQARESVIAEMQTNIPAELATLIQARTDEGVKAALAVEQRKSHVAQFSARVVGGTPEEPTGLPVGKDMLESFLLSLPAEKQEEAEKMFSDILEKGIVPFAELGHSKNVTGNRELPSEMSAILQKWVDGGNKVEAWFTANAAELGDMSEYNLAEFQEKLEWLI